MEECTKKRERGRVKIKDGSISWSFLKRLDCELWLHLCLTHTLEVITRITCLWCGRDDLLGGSILAQMHTDDSI